MKLLTTVVVKFGHRLGNGDGLEGILHLVCDKTVPLFLCLRYRSVEQTYSESLKLLKVTQRKIYKFVNTLSKLQL